jgi:hypothetical protein
MFAGRYASGPPWKKYAMLATVSPPMTSTWTNTDVAPASGSS